MKILSKIFILVIVFLIGLFLGQYFSKIQLPRETEVEKEIEVSLSLDFGQGNIKTFEGIRLEEEKTVLDLLEKVTEENDLEFSFKQYPDLGVFVESIDNVVNDFERNLWWQYWVNGEYAIIGASNYQLKNGDSVEWKYIESQL